MLRHTLLKLRQIYRMRIYCLYFLVFGMVQSCLPSNGNYDQESDEFSDIDVYLPFENEEPHSSLWTGFPKPILQNQYVLPTNYTTQKVDIFYKTYKADHDFLMASLKSVNRYAKGFRKVVIVTDEDHTITKSDLEPFSNLYIEVHHEKIPQHFTNRDRYNHQQYVKMNFFKWTDADAILSVDSDMIFYDFISPGMYISPRGKPIWLLDKYEDIFASVDKNTQNAVKEWRKDLAFFLKKEVGELEFEFMRLPTFLMTRSLATKVDTYIRNTFHKSVYEFMTEPSVHIEGKHTEYNYLGAYAYYLDTDKEYEFVRTSDAVSEFSKIRTQQAKSVRSLTGTDWRAFPVVQLHSYGQDVFELQNKIDVLTQPRIFQDYIHRNDQKYILLVLHGLTGLANRIKSLVSAKVLEELTHRKLIVIWETNPDMLAEFNDLFSNELTFFHNYRRVEKTNLVFDFPFDRINIFDVHALNNSNDVLLIDAYKSFIDESLPFKPYIELYTKHLASLKPLPEIEEKVNEFVATEFKDKFVVGVHFRAWSAAMGDDRWNIKAPKLEDFFKEMNKVIRVRPDARFLLTTDDEKIRNEFLSKYGGRIILSHIPSLSRSSVDSLRYGLVEWLLLTKTEFIIGTNMSTYSDEAALLTKKKRKINIGPNPFTGKEDPVICFDSFGKIYRCPKQKQL